MHTAQSIKNRGGGSCFSNNYKVLINKIKSFLAEKFETLYYFYRYIGYRLWVMLTCNFLMAMLDGIGLTMFVPLLQIADSKGNLAEGGKLNQYLSYVFTSLNISLTVVNMLFFIVIIFIAKAVFLYFTQYFQTQTLQIFVKKIRTELIYGLRNLNYKEFVSTDIGRLQSSLIGESNQMAQACSQYVESIKSGMVVLVYLIMAFWVDWKFSVLIVIGGILTNLIYSRFYIKTKQISRELTKENHKYGGVVIENVNNFKYLKATGRNFIFTERMLNVLYTMIDRNLYIGKLNARLTAMREPILLIIICLIIGFQVQVVGARLSSIIVILLLFYRAMAYVMSMQASWNSYLAATGSIENIKNYQIYLTKNADDYNGEQKVGNIESLKLENVSISFKEHKVLENVNVVLPANKMIALVGESGSGKSTLVNIISGLLIPDDGRYFINNFDFNNIDKNDFSKKIGYIAQEPTIFNADIFDNVTFWADRTAENIDKFWNVTALCSIDYFIKGLPNSFNELLGYNGMNISGGQKQRISIARELYRNAQLLIMDEATSALDSETESEIKESMEKLKGKVTIISIAHRLSTVRSADIIYLMNNGRIELSGDFEELKTKSSYFKKMAELQGL